MADIQQIKFENFIASIIRAKRKKTIGIHIKNKEVLVRVPPFITMPEIYNVILKRKTWIEKQLHFHPLNNHHRFEQGDIFWFEGQKHQLEIRHHPESSIRLVAEKFILVIPKRLDNFSDKKRIIAEWYASIAKQRMLPRVAHFQKLLSVQPAKVRFGLRKSRWGSCSSQKNITLNWLLVMCPPSISDYVIVHELCHLIEMNHSKVFWSLVEKILPDYQSSRRWLKENGRQLIF